MTSDGWPLFAVAGNPVAHSQSPFIHACFAKQTGMRMQYERLLCPMDDFEGSLRGFANRARGCNVTVPFKFAAFALAGHRSDRAQLAGAANTLRFDSPNPCDWYADNTDGAGLVRDIEANAGHVLQGQRLLLIGAGGAGSGALGAILNARPAEVWLVNRSEQKALALAQSHRDLASARGVDLFAGGLLDAPGHFDVVVNASASSLQGAEIPVPARVLRRGCLALDMMYGQAAQGFLDWAQAHGAEARDGLGMLVEQAAEAWVLWHDLRPQTHDVLRALRARLNPEIAR
jgi:shikimate dehydrogenase